jgi:hypothetical protein
MGFVCDIIIKSHNEALSVLKRAKRDAGEKTAYSGICGLMDR